MTTSTEEERKAAAEKKMLERMRQGQFRFSDLWMMFGANSPEYREADRLIQRERRAGRIRMVKHGLWEYTWEALNPPA